MNSYILKGFFLQSHICSTIYQLKHMKNAIHFITWWVYRIQAWSNKTGHVHVT